MFGEGLMKKNYGYTLVELVLVITLLGILVAIATPRYINMQSQARTNSLNNLNAALISAVAVVRSGYYANNRTSPVTMQNGASIAVTTTAGVAALGAPLVTSISSAVDTTGFIVTAAGGTPSGGTGPVPANTVQFDFSTPVASCYVRYANDGTTQTSSATISGC